MFYFTTGETEKKVMFRHDRRARKIRQKAGGRVIQMHPFKTTCAIIEGGKTLGVGVSKVDSRDRFTYIEGRKRALTKALADAGLSQPERTVVWDRYYAPNAV